MSIQYRRLNPLSREIRLLEIQPADNPNETVKCRLITVPHHEQTGYVALSSLYGDPTETDTMYVNGRPFTITSHIIQALKQARTVFYPAINGYHPKGRRHSAPRWLKSLFEITTHHHTEGTRSGLLRVWLDAICINQNDEWEKSKQLVNLKYIYNFSDIVVGWLGEKHEHTDIANETMAMIASHVPPNWGKTGDREAHPENYSPTHKWAEAIMHTWAEGPNGEEPCALPHWVGCVDFMTRDYLQRRWILEELSTASFPAFLIGNTIVPWKRVLAMYRVMEEFKFYDSNLFPAHLKAAICALPLEAAHKLLDEFAKREAREEARRMLVPDSRRGSALLQLPDASASHLRLLDFDD